MLGVTKTTETRQPSAGRQDGLTTVNQLIFEFQVIHEKFSVRTNQPIQPNLELKLSMRCFQFSFFLGGEGE